MKCVHDHWPSMKFTCSIGDGSKPLISIHINHHNYDLWIDVPWCTPIIHNTYGWHIYKSSINPSYRLPMGTIPVQTKRVPGLLPTRQRRPFAVSVVAIVAVVVATAHGEAADGGGVDQTVPTWPWSARVFRDKNSPKMVSPPLKMWSLGILISDLMGIFMVFDNLYNIEWWFNISSKHWNNHGYMWYVM